MLDITYGNVSQAEADRLAGAVLPVDDVPHEPGSTEPWISQLVADFIVARGARTVLETGCFQGATSVYICDALRCLGGGQFAGCEIDPVRADAVRSRLAQGGDGVHWHIHDGDVLGYLRNIRTTFDVAFVDDNHEKAHVTKELTLLYPKMNPGGLILLHDVFGVCDLQSVVQQFGGYSLDLPRLGPAGGLGIIQCR